MLQSDSPTRTAATTRLAGEVAVAFLIGVALTLIACRQGRQLTFDGYFYVEFSKQFSSKWPDRFGNDWPFGWPIAGGLLARLGVPAFWALVGLSALMLAGLLGSTAFFLRSQRYRLVLLIAVAAAPIIAPQLSGCLTDLPFAATLVGLAALLSLWPRRWAIWLAALTAILSLGLRYVGLISVGLITINVLINWRSLRNAGRLLEAIIAFAVASAASGFLLAINVLRSGHASGADRGVPEGLAAFPMELVNFGWSAPSALVAGGLRDRIGVATSIGTAVGALSFLIIVLLCACSWFCPRSAHSRLLALVTLSYCTSMAILHCLGNFDALYGGRTFLPVLAPLVILFAERFSSNNALQYCFGSALIVSGLVASQRGISREISGDVRPAVAAIRERISPTGRIGINDDAMSISAFFEQPTDRIWPRYMHGDSLYEFIVVAGRPTARAGDSAPIGGEWTRLMDRLTSTGHYRYLIRDSRLMVIERVSP